MTASVDLIALSGEAVDTLWSDLSSVLKDKDSELVKKRFEVGLRPFLVRAFEQGKLQKDLEVRSEIADSLLRVLRGPLDMKLEVVFSDD